MRWRSLLAFGVKRSALVSSFSCLRPFQAHLVLPFSIPTAAGCQLRLPCSAARALCFIVASLVASARSKPFCAKAAKPPHVSHSTFCSLSEKLFLWRPSERSLTRRAKAKASESKRVKPADIIRRYIQYTLGLNRRISPERLPANKQNTSDSFDCINNSFKSKEPDECRQPRRRRSCCR